MFQGWTTFFFLKGKAGWTWCCFKGIVSWRLVISGSPKILVAYIEKTKDLMRIYNFSLQLVLRLEIFIVDTHARGINCKTHFTGDYHFFGNLKINCPLIQYWAALSDCTGWLYSCQFNKHYLIIKLFCGISQLKALLIICIIWEKQHRNFVYEINFAINSPKKKIKKKV